jgi:RNA-directed DNA polymerase
MKRHRDIFSQICDFETLYKAYNKARKGKRYKQEILAFGYNLESNLLQLQSELKNKTYKHGAYRKFIVHDAKKREIKAATFKDRVVHKALHDVLEPFFDKSFINDSYACRKGKGVYKAISRLERFLNNPYNKYCLQCDISRYFKSVDHEKLFSLISRKIKDEDVLWLVKEIISSYSEENSYRKGIPIGNLTSQLFANLYLNELDNIVKHQLHERYYVRYMDDFLFLGGSKKELKKTLRATKGFLKDSLKLELHPSKILVFPINKGIDFLGYRVFKDYRLLRKSTVKRFLRREKKKGIKHDLEKSWTSFIAYMKHGSSWRKKEKMFHVKVLTLSLT